MLTLSGFTLGLLVGLVVGWNLLPQPAWIKALYDKVGGWVLGLFRR